MGILLSLFGKGRGNSVSSCLGAAPMPQFSPSLSSFFFFFSEIVTHRYIAEYSCHPTPPQHCDRWSGRCSVWRRYQRVLRLRLGIREKLTVFFFGVVEARFFFCYFPVLKIYTRGLSLLGPLFPL